MIHFKSTLFFCIAFSAISCGEKVASNDQQESSISAKSATISVDTINPYICPSNCENSGSKQPGICRVCELVDLGTNPNFPESDILPIGEEPTGGQKFQDTIAVEPNLSSEDQQPESK